MLATSALRSSTAAADFSIDRRKSLIGFSRDFTFAAKSSLLFLTAALLLGACDFLLLHSLHTINRFCFSSTRTLIWSSSNPVHVWFMCIL